jgi:hypothetical protein
MYPSGKQRYRRLLFESPEQSWQRSGRQLNVSCVMADQWRIDMRAGSPTHILLVFRGGNEYVFVDNEVKATVCVTLSTTAIHMFQREGLSPDELARQVTEWVLVSRQKNGSADLTTSEDLSDFCQYYFSNKSLEKQAC